jgi:DNA-binding MarR family transcriptional regulator
VIKFGERYRKHRGHEHMARKKELKPVEIYTKNLDSRMFLLFMQTSDAVQKYADAVLNKAGLSVIKLMVLQMLITSGGSLTPTEIARGTLREKHNITTLIRRLQKNGFIYVKRNSDDKRSIQVIINAKGRAKVQNALPLAMTIIKQEMSSMPEISLTSLEQPLNILKNNACEGLKSLRS